MKFIALAIIAVVKAQDAPTAKAVGTGCKVGGTDFCGPTDTMCCGIAANGMVMDAATPPAATKTPAANLVMCNKKPAGDDFTGPIGKVGDDTISAMWPGANFECLSGAKALIASAAIAMTIANMI